MEYSSSSLPATPITDSSDLAGMSSESAQDTKRRSSQRSIKRRRFDDELVEYSLGLPAGAASISKVSRSRTHSLSNTQEFPAANIILPPSITNPTPTPIEIIKKRPPPRPATSTTFSSHKGRNRKRGSAMQVTTKDLGRWKPTDDLALVTAVQRVNDIKQIHRGIKFSCRFTVQEIQQRWYALMYDEVVSRVAAAAMRNLHPELIANIQAKTLYSTAEEELLGTIKSTDTPTVETFAKLLEENQSIFYCARTPKSLMNYWQMLRLYHLLPDQVSAPPTRADQLLTFMELEGLVKKSPDDNDIKDEWLEDEIRHTDRKNKREIRQVEEELLRWQVLVDSVTGMQPPDFDNQTLAILRGRLVRYLIRSREITFGRNAKNHEVDIDLTLEGPAAKISRKQGTIKLRNNGDFFISSEGKRPIFVDGRPLLQGNKYKLTNNSTIEISSLKFTFLINNTLVNSTRHESVKTNLLIT